MRVGSSKQKGFNFSYTHVAIRDFESDFAALDCKGGVGSPSRCSE